MKKTILIVTEYFYPAFKAGGPTKSIFNMVKFLKQDYHIFIICSSKDLGSSNNLQVEAINKWLQADGYSIIYCSKIIKSIKEILISRWKINYDYLYLGSFFNPIYSLYTLLTRLGSKKDVIIAPKGEFFYGALSQKKIKKKIVINLFKLILNLLPLKWQSTNDKEKKVIKNLFNNNKINVITSSNLVTIDNLDLIYQKKYQKKINIIICGRISPVKNILMSIECINQLKGDINVEMWGAIDDFDYWNKCKERISQSPSNVIFRYKGTFHPYDIKKIFAKQHLLLMPSLSENFGYAIYEALNLGIPVITSNNTPWRDLKKNKVGFDIPLSNNICFVNALRYYEIMSNNEFIKIRKNCKKYVLNYCDLQIKEAKDSLISQLFK